MRLKKISLENIRSYENAEINFPEGDVLLSGNIGSGKSSVLLAIEFALFGMQKGISGNGLLKNGKANGKVKLNFEIDNNNIEIERKIKKAKENVQQDKCKIRINGREEELSSSEIKSRVLSLLNYPQEFLAKNPVLYRYTVYTPQEEMKTILLEDAEIRLNTLRRVFDIDKYKRISENAEKIGSKLRDFVRSREIAISDLEDKKEMLAEKEKEISRIKGDFAVLKSKHDEIEKIVKERKERVNSIENEIKELNKLKTEIASYESRLNEKKISLKRNMIEIDDLKKLISIIEKDTEGKEINDIEKISSMISEKEEIAKTSEKEFIGINKKMAFLESDKERNTKIINEIVLLKNCPTCMQNVPEEHKNKIKEKAENENAKMDIELVKEARQKEKIFDYLGKTKKEISDLRNKDKELSLIKFKLENLKERKTKQKILDENKIKDEERIKETELLISDANKKIISFNESVKNYDIAKRMLDDIVSEERLAAINKARFEKEIENISSILTILGKEISEKEKTKEKIIYFKSMNEWILQQFIPIVIEIERNVMIKVHNEFSQLFEKWFSILAEGLSARINEEFTPVIEQQGYDIDYAFLSGGERTAAALAYRLALNQVINGLMSNIKTRDLLILDEPTDGFSSEQIDKMKDILSEINTKQLQLILVSHEQKIESFVSNIIRFEKINGITKIN